MEQRFGIKRIATRSTQTEKRHVVMFEFAENSNSKYSVASLNIPEMCSLHFQLGYGKSICYQLLPVIFDFKQKQLTTVPQAKRSSVLVNSSLASLIVDQVSGL